MRCSVIVQSLLEPAASRLGSGASGGRDLERPRFCDLLRTQRRAPAIMPRPRMVATHIATIVVVGSDVGCVALFVDGLGDVEAGTGL